MSATVPTSEYTAATPKFDSTTGMSEGPMTPEMSRPNPFVVATPHARISGRAIVEIYEYSLLGVNVAPKLGPVFAQ